MQPPRYWRIDDLHGLELLRASGSRHRYVRHSHEGYAIGVVEAGAHAFTARGVTWTAVPGQIVAVDPDAAHDGHPADREGSYSYRMMYLDAGTVGAAVDAAAGRRVGLPRFSSAVVTDAPLATRLLHLHRGLELPEARLERDSLLLALLADLARRHGGGVPDRHGHDPAGRDIAPALDYLHAHFAEEIPLATLAGLAGVDRFRLIRGFRRTAGLPPHRYQIQLRLRHARRLLLAGESPARAAALAGFADQSHFIRRFKAVHGVTPGEFLGRNNVQSPEATRR